MASDPLIVTSALTCEDTFLPDNSACLAYCVSLGSTSFDLAEEAPDLLVVCGADRMGRRGATRAGCHAGCFEAVFSLRCLAFRLATSVVV